MTSTSTRPPISQGGYVSVSAPAAPPSAYMCGLLHSAAWHSRSTSGRLPSNLRSERIASQRAIYCIFQDSASNPSTMITLEGLSHRPALWLQVNPSKPANLPAKGAGASEAANDSPGRSHRDSTFDTNWLLLMRDEHRDRPPALRFNRNGKKKHSPNESPRSSPLPNNQAQSSTEGHWFLPQQLRKIPHALQHCRLPQALLVPDSGRHTL